MLIWQSWSDEPVFRGESFRGKKLETVSLQTGKVQAVEPLTIQEEEKSKSWVVGFYLLFFGSLYSDSNWLVFPDTLWS